MLKLIKLEFKRNNLKSYLYGVLGIFIFTILIGILFSAIPKIEKGTSASQIFMDKNMLIIMITVISMSGFAILSAVMYTKFIVDEYTTKKNILLFTYPQKRSSIFMAKFIFISAFTLIMMIISNVFSILLIGLIGKITGIMNTYFKDIVNIVLISVIFAFIANLISVISLKIGFWKKSIIVTIITSVILVAPFGNSIMLFKNNLIDIIIPLLAILILINIILVGGLLKKINKMECL